jgi:predicted ABC-type transport system involved in lysophospholipase L1 biosynthesis ATPase subunit
MLQARNLHRTYHLSGHDLPVLRGVDLEVQAGEKVFLCGQSGAGKTSLLYVLGGLERPDQGEVSLEGQSLYNGSGAKRARLRNERMGFVFQQFFLLPELTALENVCLPARIGGKNSRSRAIELLERVGLGERLNHLPSELSGGEQQRVAIARALINQPQMIFADEPTGNLDAQTGAGVMQVLMELVRDHQAAMVVVTHDLNLTAMADRTLLLKEGHLQPRS